MTTLRTATPDDLDALIAMGEALQDESRTHEPLLSFDRQQSRDHYAKELQNPHAKITVALDENSTVIGYHYSYVTTLDYLHAHNRECVFEAVYVQPEYRGKGIAKELTKDAERWAFETMDADRIKSGVYVGNAASEELHTREGFVPYYTEFIKRHRQ